jgi:CubicO group peptidase (beta-lactamase class C family)
VVVAPDAQVEEIVRQAVAPAPFGSEILPGAILLVADGLRVVSWTSHGVVSFGQPSAPSIEGSSRVGSITKTFVAALVLQLVEQGQLSLSTDLGSLGLELEGVAGVTIEQALAMRSGFHDVSEVPELFAQITAAPSRVWTDRELAPLGLSRPADFAPGERFGYSNTNSHVLALALEKVTGKPLRELLRQGLLEERGLESTSLPAGGDAALPASALRGAGGAPRAGRSARRARAWTRRVQGITTAGSRRSHRTTPLTPTHLNPAEPSPGRADLRGRLWLCRRRAERRVGRSRPCRRRHHRGGGYRWSGRRRASASQRSRPAPSLA